MESGDLGSTKWAAQLLFQECRDQFSGSRGAVRGYAGVGDLGSDIAQYHGSQSLWCGRAKLELHASPMALDSSGHVNALLKVAFQREIDERTPQRRELESCRTAPLHDGQVAGRQVLIESVNIAHSLNTVGQPNAVSGEAGPADCDHLEIGHLALE